MSDYVLRSPKEHFIRAAELANRCKFLTNRAKEWEITDDFVAAELRGHAELNGAAAVFHIAKAFEAMAVLKELGINPETS
jgi:hypothetical protein